MPAVDLTYDLSLIDKNHSIWNSKSGLRAVYRNLFLTIKSHCSGDQILELGSGNGASRTVFDKIVTTDVVQTKYVDRAMSAYGLELNHDAKPWSDIIAVDMLHHLRFPLKFFQSASAVLQAGGRIVLVEPAATPFGTLFYRCCHHEPIARNEVMPPFEFSVNGDGNEFANMAMGVGLFCEHREFLDKELKKYGLSIKSISFSDFLAYPLTGGYSKPQLLPTKLISFLSKVEQRFIPQKCMSVLGLRMCIVIEKD